MWSRGSLFSVRSKGVEVSCQRHYIQCGRGGGEEDSETTQRTEHSVTYMLERNESGNLKNWRVAKERLRLLCGTVYLADAAGKLRAYYSVGPSQWLHKDGRGKRILGMRAEKDFAEGEVIRQ